MRSAAWAVLTPIAQQAARVYTAGPKLQDALRVRDRFLQSGGMTTIGYFNWAKDSPREIANLNLAAIRALTGSRDYVSIKLSTIHYGSELLEELIRAATDCGVRLHMDSLQPETVDPTWTVVEGILSRKAGCELGVTLAARWRRAVGDARWARQHPLHIRVVKGEWADPADPRRDPRAGFLQVIDELAYGARHVAVASHDLPLASEAISKLQAAGIPCDLELLYGLPMRASFAVARRLNVPVRVYVPFGEAMLRYAINHVVSHPRLTLFLARDFIASLLHNRPK